MFAIINARHNNNYHYYVISMHAAHISLLTRSLALAH